MKVQVPHTQYAKDTYNNKYRWISYWHQIVEILKRENDNVLEIGIGNKFVSNYLKNNGIKIICSDFDKKLKPDFVNLITNLPLRDNSFDIVSCYEVLEHMPYTDSINALNELYRVSKRNVIISVPDCTTAYRVNIHFPIFGEVKKLLPRPFYKPPLMQDGGEHYWEIGKKNYPLAMIKKDIESCGFNIDYTYRVYEYIYHRFFILSKV